MIGEKMNVYSAGLRVGEVIRLKTEDVDSVELQRGVDKRREVMLKFVLDEEAEIGKRTEIVNLFTMKGGHHV
jgi:integrase